MSYFSVDCEMDGMVVGVNSMVCFGAVVIRDDLKDTYYGETAPISTVYEEEALAISGFSRKEHEKFPSPTETMGEFEKWVQSVNRSGRPIFVSDNPLDFAYINHYLHVYTGKNIFGWSGRRIGDLFCGFYKDAFYKWKKHRITDHSHNPVDDAKGNAEAMLYLRDQGLKIKLL